MEVVDSNKHQISPINSSEEKEWKGGFSKIGSMRGPFAWLVPEYLRQGLGFTLIYAAYMFFYFNRKNYAFWLNEMITLGRNKEDISIFGSVMEFSYGFGKLIAGPLVDSKPPYVVLVVTLGIASLCNLLMFQSDSLLINYALWSINGLVQSAAWPALAAIFLNWFKLSPYRGTWYSILSTNQNFGSALCPILLTPLVKDYGWRIAVTGPGISGMVMTVVLFMFLQEFPSEHYVDGSCDKSIKKTQGNKSSWVTVLSDMVTNPYLLGLGIGYSFLSLIRVGISGKYILVVRLCC